MNDDFKTLEIAGKYSLAMSLMYEVRDIIEKKKLSQRMFVSRSPVGNYEFRTVVYGDLLNKKKEKVGKIRIFIFVSLLHDDLKVRIEWTRNAFGFWYREDYVVMGGTSDDADFDRGKFKMKMRPVEWTANGSVSLKSMNLYFKKIKKSKIRDRGVRSGLVL